MLETLRIATPCPASWAQMEGDDRRRFCGECRLHVYNLTAMTRAHAEAFLERSEGRLCVRLYRRRDGTVITADCPVGVRARFAARFKRLAVAGTGLLLLGLLGVGASDGSLFRAWDRLRRMPITGDVLGLLEPRHVQGTISR